MDEVALRDKWLKEAKEQTMETLPAWLETLKKFPHEYGTAPRALAAAAVGVATALNRTDQFHITGFQGSFVKWDFLKGWEGFDGNLRLQKGDDLMYPQYARKFNSIPESFFNDVVAKAKKKLENTSNVSPEVKAHWEKLAKGEVPFGLAIEKGE